jgi:TonB-dependent receptor-like protein/carboxypeptidase family protein
MRPSVRPLSLLVLVASLSTCQVAAQQPTGRVEVTVTDPTGAALGGVEASVLGTALRVVADTAGRFVFRFVPAGLRTVRVQAPGYPPQDQEVRVWAGEVARLAVQLGVPTLVASEEAPGLLHRDGFSSGGTLTGEALRNLPIDDPRQAFHLIPGMFLRGPTLGADLGIGATNRTASGGRPAAYIDGAPVRLGLFSTHELTLGAGMIEQVTVNPGAVSPLAPDASGGVVSYVTPVGGERIQGRIRLDSDEPFGNGSTVGYNLLEGAVGGPVPRVPNLRWFIAASGQGQRSQYRGMGAEAEPTYVLGGRDTTVSEIDAVGNAVRVEVPRFVQFSGTCGTIGSAGSAAARDIAANYGFECQGLRRPMDWSSSLRALGKLFYSFGEGSTVSLTTLATGEQLRGFPGSLINAPSLYVGAHVSSRLLVLDARHVVSLGRRPLALHVNLSRGVDRAASGPLATQAELETRTPALGIELGTLRFTGADLIPFPLTDQIVRNIRTNTGLRVPFLNRTDLRSVQAGRMNPFGLRGGGWPTQGLDGQLTMLSEARVEMLGDAEVDMGPHRLAIGVEVGQTHVSAYTSGLLDQAFMDAFVAHPRRLGLAAADRVDLGSLNLEVGLRYQRVDVGALFPKTPYRVFTHPRYAGMYLSAPTDDATYAAFLADTNIWVPSHGQSAVSPSIRVAYHVGQRTILRAGYSNRLVTPPLGEWLTGSNSDLSFTNTSATVGRDLELRTSTTYELAAQHVFGKRVAVDLGVFQRDGTAPYQVRIRGFDDPANPGDTLNAWVWTSVASGSATGVEGRFELAPLSWLRLAGSALRVTDKVEGPVVTSSVTSNALSAALTVQGPRDRADLGRARALVDGVEGHVVLRAVSGAPYTRMRNDGSGGIAPGPMEFFGLPVEQPLASRLPWTKYLDLRVSKPVTFGRLHWSAYLDVRNVFNWRNLERLFTETSDVTNLQHRQQFLASEFAQLENEATAAGAWVGNDALLNDCSTWTSAVNCVMLRRTEARFGNGDGTYTQVEQTIALNAWYDSIYAPWTFYGPGRTVRVGFQASF